MTIVHRLLHAHTMMVVACAGLFQATLVDAQNITPRNTERYFAELPAYSVEQVSVFGGLNAPGSLGLTVNRFSDDGSVALVDDSGIILWKLNDGRVLPLPNTGKAKPLFVSNRHCIVWRNAYEQFDALRRNCQITYFTIDSVTNQLVETSVNLFGNVVFDTPVISLSNQAYTVLTGHIETQPGARVSDAANPQNLYIYKLPFDPNNIQLLNFYSYDTQTDPEAIVEGIEFNIGQDGIVFSANTVASAPDGSYVIRLNDPHFSGFNNAMESLFLWIAPEGNASPIFSEDDEFVLEQEQRADATIAFVGGSNYFRSTSVDELVRINLRVVNVTGTVLQFGAENDSEFIYSYKRVLNTDAVASEGAILSLDDAGGATGSVVGLPINAAKLPGELPIFLVQRAAPDSTVDLYRLNGDVLDLKFSAVLPSRLFSALTQVVASTIEHSTNDNSEAIAFFDPNNGGVVWLHDGPGIDDVNGGVPTVNYSLLDEPEGEPLIVTDGELLIWSNANSPNLPNAVRPVILVNHFGRDGVGGVDKNQVLVSSDAQNPTLSSGSSLRGIHVLPAYPYAVVPLLWRLESYEYGANSGNVYRYLLLSRSEIDSDSDGILTGLEEGPFYVIPGKFTYDEAVKDAARRGGRLATIEDASEFAAMQQAITLWSQQSRPIVFPLRKPPYPLWIGLEDSGGWRWSDLTSDGYIAGNWAPGEPSVEPGRSNGQLTDSLQWKASNPASRSGYLLELTVTDPDQPDTDADGGSDYDELFRLITEPTVANFGAAAPAVPVDYANPLVNGSYEGFVTDLHNGPVGSLRMKISRRGSFSGRLVSADTQANLRGQLLADGTVSFIPIKFRGLYAESFLSLQLQPDPVSGSYRIQGRITGGFFNSGDPTVLELRRAAYSKSLRTADAGNYTVILPPAVNPKVGEPLGYGNLSIKVGSDGRSSASGLTSNGFRLKWSGTVMEGDFLSFFAAMRKPTGLAAGNLFFRQYAQVDSLLGLVGESDIDGDILISSNAHKNGPGYFMRSLARGSRYYQGSYYQVPAFDVIPLAPGNIVVEFDRDNFGGAPIVGTWTERNAIEIPKTQTHDFRAKVNARSGILKGSYTYRDPNFGYPATKSKIHGVVLQKSGEVLGNYIVGSSRTGPLEIKPNSDNSPLLANRISPRSKTVQGSGAVYQVYLTTDEPWTAVVDPSSGTFSYTGNPNTWISLSPSSGSGSGVVTLQVSSNNGGYPREADVVIAGVRHRVKQEWSYTGGGANFTTISPASKGVNANEQSYFISYSNYPNAVAQAPVIDFYTLENWIAVTPFGLESGVEKQDENTGLYSGMAQITVAANEAFVPRTGSVTIAGITHTIVQAAASPF